MDFDVIFVGGDISYDNGISECYQWYDHLLNRLPHQKVNPQSGFIRLIPLMFSIGNHDVGVNSNSGHKIHRDKSHPVFYHFYPQNTFENDVPSIDHRNSYLTHRIGEDILFLSLDTGYDTPIKNQTKWLEEQLKGTFKYKFIQYHHPFYSACTKGEKYGVANEGRDQWVPLFDQYKVTMVFENHVHGFKRTKPLKNSSVSEDGIIYIGDGSWGPLLSSWTPANQNLMEKSSEVHHVWILRLKGNGEIDVKAYGTEGQVIDEFTKKVD
jgi:acid phosphatase type 7